MNYRERRVRGGVSFVFFSRASKALRWAKWDWEGEWFWLHNRRPHRHLTQRTYFPVWTCIRGLPPRPTKNKINRPRRNHSLYAFPSHLYPLSHASHFIIIIPLSNRVSGQWLLTRRHNYWPVGDASRKKTTLAMAYTYNLIVFTSLKRSGLLPLIHPSAPPTLHFLSNSHLI